MATARNDDAKKWTVQGVNAGVDVATGGVPVKGNTVTFLTAAGNRGQVFVPDTASLDQTRDMIAARVEHIDGIANLTG